MQPQSQSQQPSREPAPRAETPSPPQGGGSGPSGPAGSGHGAVKWIAAVIGIVVAIFAVGEIRKNLAARQRPQQALVPGVEERRELGLSPQATHGEIWAAARKRPLERIQLCAGSDTVIMTHNMGTGDQASVNGTPVNISSTGYQPISIPSDAVAVQIAGLSGEGGEVLFVLDTFPNQRLADLGTTQNSCDLKESHNVVAVKVDEIATIRIVR